MNVERLSPKGLLQPHVHYSFLKTASEGLSQDESDSESLAQEIAYQFELQKRINKTETLVDPSCEEEEEEESLEEDSLEENVFREEEMDAGESHIPSGTSHGKENCNNESVKEKNEDPYSELRYNPNWKNQKEGASFIGLGKSCLEDAENSNILPLDLAYSPSQFSLISSRSRQLREPTQNAPCYLDREVLNSCDQTVSSGAYKLLSKEQQAFCHYASRPRANSDSCAPAIKEYKKRSGRDFVEKNKLTLGLAAQQNFSYLQLHSKKQTGDHQGQAHLCQTPRTGRTNTSQAASLEENPLKRISIQSPLGAQAELRSQNDRCHNMLEFENARGSSNSYREASDCEQDRRCLLHHTLYSNQSVMPLSPSIANSSLRGNQFPIDLAHSVHQNGKPQSMTVTFARDPFQPNLYSDIPGLHLPCAGEKKKKYHPNPENTSGTLRQHPDRCTVSEPRSTARHGTHQILVGHRSLPLSDKAGFLPPVKGDISSGNARWINTEQISGSHVSGNAGPSHPATRLLIQARSPTTRLIQAAEEHHREISQLADDYLAGSQFASMFPPIIQRAESDARLNLGSGEESRCNSEGYLLQADKEKEKKSSMTKGYVKMDVKLGGLGPDYEAVKEKSEKMKQQKEYAKHVKEHNMKNISYSRKVQPRPENKLAVPRQKALEYAKRIPKPKLFVPRPLEPEPKDENDLAHALNRGNLPPISSLESLQNRHEKEKQVVAAFKTLHIV